MKTLQKLTSWQTYLVLYVIPGFRPDVVFFWFSTNSSTVDVFLQVLFRIKCVPIAFGKEILFQGLLPHSTTASLTLCFRNS
jgi:hypothetical protein